MSGGRRAHSDYGGPSQAKYSKQYNGNRIPNNFPENTPQYLDEHGNPVQVVFESSNNNQNDVLYPLQIEAGENHNQNDNNHHNTYQNNNYSPNPDNYQDFQDNFHVQNHYEHREPPPNHVPPRQNQHNSNQRQIYQNYQQQNQNLRQSNYNNHRPYLAPVTQSNNNYTTTTNSSSNKTSSFSPSFYPDSPNTDENPPQTPNTYVEKTQKDGEIAAFIQKIDAMLTNCLNDKQYWTDDGRYPLMSWSEDGTSFIIRDPESFTNKVIPAHFRHKNRASFVRQLNQYGFKKKNRMDNDSLINATRRDEQLEYMHPHFLRDNRKKWHLVKRAKNDTKVERESRDSVASDRDRIREKEMQELIQEVQKFRQEQKAMAEELKEVQQQNARLTDSNAELFKRDKYNKHCLKKLCSLLVNHFRPAQSNNGAPFPEIMGGFGSIMQGLGTNGSWVS